MWEKVEDKVKAISHLRHKQHTVLQMAVGMEEQEQVHNKKSHISSELIYEECPTSKEDLKPKRTYLDGCPCFICRNLGACGVGHEISPILCSELGIWAQELAKRKR